MSLHWEGGMEGGALSVKSFAEIPMGWAVGSQGRLFAVTAAAAAI